MKEWLEYIKNIKPIKQKDFVEKPEICHTIKPQTEEFVYVSQGSNGVDGATRKKFKQEKFEIAARLDLHGFTYEQAFDATTKFVKNAYMKQKRCILIVTGKGEVIQNNLPKWLENPEIKNMILETAHPSNALGGSGALMILIKRIRNT